MTTLTQPLHDEHRELLPEVERILQAAEAAREGPVGTLPALLDEVYDFLAHHLLAHAQAEEAALYPAVQRALGTPKATATMARDHVEVGRYIEELRVLRSGISARLSEQQARQLQRVLYGIYALLKLHFAKEEEVYLPILDEYLTPESAREMFESMEAAAARAKQALASA